MDPVASSAVAAASGTWHRKWLLLGAVLVWGYFLRFRLLGWLLSQALTFALRWRAPRLRARAQVQYITLRPLELGHVLVTGGDCDWRVVCTRVAVVTHVLEFFRSFVQKKMLVLAVEDVFVDLLRLDEELLRDFVRAADEAARITPRSRATSTDACAARTPPNPMGFMRFIDVRIRNISINVDAFDTRSRFRCSELSLNIPEVNVAQNVLHLSVSVASVFASSRPLQNTTMLSGAVPTRRDSANAGGVGQPNGVSCELGRTIFVLDVRLTDQNIIGCNVESNSEEPAFLHVSTTYVSHLLTKKMELIRRDLVPIPKWIWHAEDSVASATARGPSSTPFTLRVGHFPVKVHMIHGAPGGSQVPLQLEMHIRRLEYAKNGPEHKSGQRSVSSTSTIGAIEKDCEGIRMTLDCQSICLAHGDVNVLKLVTTSWCRVEMARDNSGHGRMHCEIGELELAVNPSMCEVLHSLVLFPDVIDDHERATVALMFEWAARKQNRPTPAPKLKVPVQWAISVDIEAWSLQSWLRSVDDTSKRDLEARGKRTTLHSTIPPKLSGLAMKHEVKVGEVDVRVSLQSSAARFVPEDEEYRVQFTTLSISTTKLSTTASKSMEVSLWSSSVTLNAQAEGEENGRVISLPQLLISNLAFGQTELETEEVIQIGVTLTATDVDAKTSHLRHQQILREFRTVLDILDKVRIMLTPPDPPGSNQRLLKDGATKAFQLSVSASSVQVELLDVKDVSRSVEFALNEMKVMHHKSATKATSTVTCAFVKLIWDSDTVMNVAGVWFDQAADTKPPSDMLSDVDASSSSDITISQIQMWLRPERRLLLLFLKLDELVNSNNDPDHSGSAGAPKRSSKQKLSFTCMKMGIQVLETDPTDLQENHDVSLDQVKVHANMSKSTKINDAILRYLHATRRDETCRSRLIDCMSVLGVDGTLNIQSLELSATKTKHVLLHVDECQLNFATSDVCSFEETGPSDVRHHGKHVLPPKILLFEVSSVAKFVKLEASPNSRDAANRVLPVLQSALDTRPSSTSTVSSDESVDWRLRYVGSFDCGIKRAVVAVPFASDVFTSAYQSPLYVSDRFVMVSIDQVAFNCRQFQKLSLQFDLLRVAVTDHDIEDEAINLTNIRPASDDGDLPLQVLYLPRTKLDAVIHWREKSEATTAGLHTLEQFAVSFDLVMRGSPSSQSDQVPLVEEALLSVNWEYIFPALVFLVTEEDGDRQGSTGTSVGATDETKTAVECVGIQWNMSLDCVQIAWWDVMTQESAILVVIHDALSHGIVKRQLEGANDASSEPTWVLWETTVYLDLVRSYLLREAHVEEDCITLACGALPFQPTTPAYFFVETTGTSYRATHALCGSEPSPGEGGNGVLFGELSFLMVEKIHDHFERVEYDFGCANPRPSFSEQSSWSTQPNTSTGSPPKSPRAWTQSVRAKLARLKRRTSSMDNMLLNDGSRPIQVDSMKLLWTIETRDSVFNMVAVIGDSVEVILEASRQRHDSQRSSSIHSDQALATSRTNSDQHRQSVVQAESLEASRPGRRGSTRDSLLELLNQGKLGKKDASTMRSDGNSTSWQSTKGEHAGTDNDDMYLSKKIKDKRYTLDVHDVQINILEETSRSSALIASRHIHLEVGVDEPATTTIATLKFECVTGHVAPTDVDVSVGVLWYSHGRNSIHSSVPPRTFAANTTLLKQVMEEFTLSTVYSQGMTNGETSVEVDMSSLQLSTDRSQFYQLLNVLRHVLLAPPTVINRVKRQFTSRRDQPSEVCGDDSVVPPLPMASTPIHSGKKLHAQLVEELRIRDSKMLGTSRSSQVLLKLISFRSAGCVYRLRASPESAGGDHEFVEIRAEGITGSHSFFTSQKTKFVLNLQWLEINNLRPGPSSIAFEDATSVLKAKLLVDQRYQSSSRVHLLNQKGMLSVRAESGPQTRVLGQKLRILDVLEISIFPEIPNMIVIQLAADFYEMLYKFFFEQMSSVDPQETHNELSLFGKKGSASAITSSLVPQSPVAKARAYTSPASPPHPVTVRRKSIQSSSVTASSNGSESALSVTTSVAADPTADDDDSSADGCELFYFKYVRIGNVRLRINCNGFFVNLNNFDLDLPPYVCQSKLCTWKKLLQKFESHLKWYVTKESASTGLSHFKNKLLKWTPTSSSGNDKKEKQKKEDSSMMNAQVLFGPYSGTQ